MTESLLAHASAAGVLDLTHGRVFETYHPTRTGIEGPRLPACAGLLELRQARSGSFDAARGAF